MRSRWLLAALAAPMLVACTPRDDGCLLLRRRAPRAPHERTTLSYAEPDDAAGLVVRQWLADGFGAELLRTHAMARRLAGRAGDPAIVALGAADAAGAAPQFDGGWFRQTLPAGTPIVWIKDDDDALATASPIAAQLTVGLAEAIVDTAVGAAPPAVPALREGYAAFLTVLGAEWHPPNAAAARARDDLRRFSWFAAVRANDAVRARGTPATGSMAPAIRSGDAQVGDPLVVATVLYRMASSPLGRTMAPEAVYRPFLADPPPHGVHPALLLGAFRNFQAKLLTAWRAARVAGHPPRDLVDLVEAYGATFPAERAEATRILLVTTYGATAERHGPVVRGGWVPGDDIDRRLAALTADVLFGRVGLRDGLAAPARPEPDAVSASGPR
jgi:hypothetical protein